MPRGAGRDQLDASILPAAFFALWAQRRMFDFGTRPETFGAIAAKNWNHGALNPLSHRRPDHVVTVEEVMASRMIAEPLTAMDVLPGRRRRRRRHRGQRGVRPSAPSRPSGRAMPVLGRAERGLLDPRARLPRAGGRPTHHDWDHGSGGLRRGRGRPGRRVVTALCHDAFANEELEYYELLGFCGPGEGDKLVANGETALGGSIPFNTDGGLMARGHPGGPTGAAMVHEVALQLRHEAGARQVEDARVGLAHCVGGGSVCTVNIFEGVD